MANRLHIGTFLKVLSRGKRPRATIIAYKHKSKRYEHLRLRLILSIAIRVRKYWILRRHWVRTALQQRTTTDKDDRNPHVKSCMQILWLRLIQRFFGAEQCMLEICDWKTHGASLCNRDRHQLAGEQHGKTAVPRSPHDNCDEWNKAKDLPRTKKLKCLMIVVRSGPHRGLTARATKMVDRTRLFPSRTPSRCWHGHFITSHAIPSRSSLCDCNQTAGSGGTVRVYWQATFTDGTCPWWVNGPYAQ